MQKISGLCYFMLMKLFAMSNWQYVIGRLIFHYSAQQAETMWIATTKTEGNSQNSLRQYALDVVLKKYWRGMVAFWVMEELRLLLLFHKGAVWRWSFSATLLPCPFCMQCHPFSSHHLSHAHNTHSSSHSSGLHIWVSENVTATLAGTVRYGGWSLLYPPVLLYPDVGCSL